MRYAILTDYGIEEHTHPIVDLIVHLAYFVHELVEDSLRPESDWLQTRYQNLVCGPHEDAHMFVDAAFDGNWEEFWDHVHEYTDELPEDAGKYGREGVEQLLWELAFLGNCVHRTIPDVWDEWPESFYQSHFEMDLGEHDEHE